MGNRYLLDTHSLIWFQENSPRLSKKVCLIIENPENIIFFSQINIFELVIKQKVGKLSDFAVPIEAVYDQALIDSFSYLNIDDKHLYRYQRIALFDNHRDPFDRLLIATAIEEGLTIISGDDKFKLYKDIVEVIW